MYNTKGASTDGERRELKIVNNIYLRLWWTKFNKKKKENKYLKYNMKNL